MGREDSSLRCSEPSTCCEVTGSASGRTVRGRIRAATVRPWGDRAVCPGSCAGTFLRRPSGDGVLSGADVEEEGVDIVRLPGMSGRGRVWKAALLERAARRVHGEAWTSSSASSVQPVSIAGPGEGPRCGDRGRVAGLADRLELARHPGTKSAASSSSIPRWPARTHPPPRSTRGGSMWCATGSTPSASGR